MSGKLKKKKPEHIIIFKIFIWGGILSDTVKPV